MPLSSPLSILPSLDADLRRTEDELLASVTGENELLSEIAAHLIHAGGKRVRPGFSMAAAASLDPVGAPASFDVIRGGVAVELVHIGSLYHDDVMDDASTRRSVVSVNSKWGNLRAILAGDYLLARASMIAADLGTEVAALLASTIASLCEGQILELESVGNPNRTEDEYLRSIKGKTASLLGTACRVGSLVAGHPQPIVEALTVFGQAYGVAFQMVDDILDLIGSDELLGKPAGNDLMEGIFTLPVIHTLAQPGSDRLRELLSKPLNLKSRDEARTYVRNGSGIDHALFAAQEWADTAAQSLDDLPDTPGAQSLRAAAAHLIERARLPLA